MVALAPARPCELEAVWLEEKRRVLDEGADWRNRTARHSAVDIGGKGADGAGTGEVDFGHGCCVPAAAVGVEHLPQLSCVGIVFVADGEEKHARLVFEELQYLLCESLAQSARRTGDNNGTVHSCLWLYNVERWYINQSTGREDSSEDWSSSAGG